MDAYIRIDIELRKQLKIKSAELGTSIKSLAEKYILQGLEKEKNNMKNLTVIRVINSYTGKDDWGYDCVEGSDGNIWHVRQEPDSNWKVGEDISKAKKSKE
jgi:hypothetical protein